MRGRSSMGGAKAGKRFSASTANIVTHPRVPGGRSGVMSERIATMVRTHMNQTANSPIPDSAMLGSEVELGEKWDSAAIARLIRSKSSLGESPAFLFLGKQEAAMLRRHLERAFGAEAVTTLRTTYYM